MLTVSSWPRTFVGPAKPNVNGLCMSSKLGSILCNVFGADRVAHVADRHLPQGSDCFKGGYLVVGVTLSVETILQSQCYEDAHFNFTFSKADGQPCRPWGAPPPPPRKRACTEVVSPAIAPPPAAHILQQYTAPTSTPYPYPYPAYPTYMTPYPAYGAPSPSRPAACLVFGIHASRRGVTSAPPSCHCTPPPPPRPLLPPPRSICRTHRPCSILRR